MSAVADDLTRQLNLLSAGDEQAHADLYKRIQTELRNLAEGLLRRERPGHTLQATVLIDHAFLELLRLEEVSFPSRRAFYAFAARAMRHLLVDSARRRNALARGGGRPDLGGDALAAVVAPVHELGVDLFALDRALESLAAVDPQQGTIFQLHYFAGMTRSKIAEALGLTLSRVKDELAFGRAWLLREVQRLLADDDFQAEVRCREEEALRQDRPSGG